MRLDCLSLSNKRLRLLSLAPQALTHLVIAYISMYIYIYICVYIPVYICLYSYVYLFSYLQDSRARLWRSFHVSAIGRSVWHSIAIQPHMHHVAARWVFVDASGSLPSRVQLHTCPDATRAPQSSVNHGPTPIHESPKAISVHTLGVLAGHKY